MRKHRKNSLRAFLRNGSILLATGLLLFSCREGSESKKMIRLEWNNPPQETDKANRYYLSISNQSPVTLTSENWALYFNSLHSVYQPESETRFKLTHVNSGFYYLTLTEGTELKPGKSLKAALNFDSPLIKYSSLPMGFYTVFQEKEGKEFVQEIPFDGKNSIREEDLTRSKKDHLAVPTARSRYEENAKFSAFDTEQTGNIIPTPVKQVLNSEVFHCGSALNVSGADGFQTEVAVFRGEVGNFLNVGSEGENTDATPLRLVRDADLKRDSEYMLSLSNDKGIEIRAASGAGIFYGLQSLYSLLSPLEFDPSAVLYEQVINDYPRFPYRGLHIDVSRNFHGISEMKQMMDALSMYKMNKLYLHLGDDEGWRLEIPDLPELTEFGARRGHTLDEADHLIPLHGSGPFVKDHEFFSRVEFIDLLTYAAQRHMDIVPEFDFPGHARAAVKSMEFRYRRYAAQGDMEKADEFRLIDPADSSVYHSVQRFDDNVVDPGLESTYRFFTVLTKDLKDMYADAGLELKLLDLGGDEVARGVWEKSPACAKLKESNPDITERHDIFTYFFVRCSKILAEQNIQLGGWEEVAVEFDKNAGKLTDGAGKPVAFIWNSVWGWGREDLAYTLAESGFPVVLANVTNLYFDLAYDKDPEEAGLYWGGFTDTRKVYEFTPENFAYCAWTDRMGNPFSAEQRNAFHKLAPEAAKNIIGLQGELWSEELPTAQRLQYMAFPKTVALAERSWSAKPAWAVIDDDSSRLTELDKAWAAFCAELGSRELRRLDKLGIGYRLPLPGAVREGNVVSANCLFPGLTLRYTLDGSVPNASSPLYEGPLTTDKEVRLRSFSTDGRGSRCVRI